MLNFLYIPQADPNPLPLLDSPWPILLILSSYLIFVLKVGRIYMENRQPYKLKRVLRVYNLLQVLYNAICFGVVYVIYIAWKPFHKVMSERLWSDLCILPSYSTKFSISWTRCSSYYARATNR
ncbi:uncharacterized protein LOC6638175 isoform X2 [Drosophila willistoni]|uniref:uncharacterized protein LOC6638175 isoform X2 n=1 Tax=Drosophila willistoni TaxID=7260 RepID=UPI001F084C2E|nr:uncharacterized protein LOC6638175 isoform X2 [Drosophila willistoni]